MKRAPILSAVFLLGSLAAVGLPREAQTKGFPNPLLDAVVEMTRAEVPDATILAFLRARRARLDADVTAQDLIRLHRAGVHDEVVAYIAGVAGLEAPAASEKEAPAAIENEAPAAIEREAPPAPEAEPPAAEKPDSEPADVEPVPVDDGGLVMGVYDPIPVNNYPCWPPGWWGVPSDACGDVIFIGGSGFVGRGRHGDRARVREGAGPADGVRRGGDDRRGGRPGDRPQSDRGGRGTGSGGPASAGSGHAGGHGGHPGGGRGPH